MGTRVRVRPIPWSSPDAYPSGGNPSLSHRWAKWHSRLMAPIESRTPDWRMGFGLQTARTGLRYRNPVIERTAISRVSKSFRGDLQPGKVAMPRGPRSEKRPADVIGATDHPSGNHDPSVSHRPRARHSASATGWCDSPAATAPTYLVRDNDRAYGQAFHARHPFDSHPRHASGY